ncbi:MAG: ABC transporter substrate-binding protein [Promethearchaeota archaeon]
MKNHTKLLLLSTTLLFFLLPIGPTLSQTSLVDRDKIVWATGYDTKANSLMPYNWDIAYGIAYMYEPLFGYDYYKDKLIPVIGESYNWAPDGTYLHITLNPNAEWSDGEAIDADDVIYTFRLANATWRHGGNMQARIKSITKIDPHTLRIYVNSQYNFSVVVEDWLRTFIVILPEHVWSKIAKYEWGGDLSQINFYTNDWFDSSFNSSYKVCSGPYQPYYRSSTRYEDIYERRDDWWGLGRIHTDLPNSTGIPNAKYIGLRHYDTNTGKETALITGAVDLSSGFVDSFSVVQDLNPNLGTFYDSLPYYVSLGSVIEVAFNHKRYPFVETWLRKAMAYSLNYDAINLFASGGYWRRAKQGWIDNESYVHNLAGVYNDTIQQQYGISYNVSKAAEILDTYCYLKNGKWYTDDVPVQYLGWPGATDDDAVTAGVNVELGGWEIYVVAGWSDVIKAAEAWAQNFWDINITCTKREVDFSSFYQPAVDNFDFDMVLDVVNPHLLNTPLSVFGGKRGVHAWWGNSTGWVNAEFYNLFEQYESLTPGSIEQKIAASRMQELLASEIPAIPTHVNGYWYTYSTEYWDGWITETNDYQQLATAFEITSAALKQRLILNLVPSEISIKEEELIPWRGLLLFAFIGVISTIVVIKIRLKKLEKKDGVD